MMNIHRWVDTVQLLQTMGEIELISSQWDVYYSSKSLKSFNEDESRYDSLQDNFKMLIILESSNNLLHLS